MGPKAVGTPSGRATFGPERSPHADGWCGARTCVSVTTAGGGLLCPKPRNVSQPAQGPVTDQGSASGAPRLDVVQVVDTHAEVLAEFIREVWDPRATPESVMASRREASARNVAEPGVPPPTWIALRSGKCLGYVTTIPIRLWDGQRDWPAYWIKGLMVLPEFRSGPIGYLVLKAAVARLPRTGALAVAPPARRLFEALGYTDLGAVPNLIRPLAPHRMLKRLDLAGVGLSRVPVWAPAALRFAQATGLATLGGWAGGTILRAAALGLRLSSGGLDAGPVDPTSSLDQLSKLWRAVSDRFPAAVVRDPSYLVHRYPVGKESPYTWLGVRERGVLAGVAILRRPRSDGDERLRGIRLATLADVVYRPDRPTTGLALLGAAERTARMLGADAILASSSAPALSSLLRRQFYLPISGNVHFLLRDVTGEGAVLSQALSDWWLTRGDGLADEVF
jgi:GNAT superfamily N-acetyltransferase